MIPAIENVYNACGVRPELSESEIMTLGRLSMGWLLSETEGYLERTGVVLENPALDVYCCATFRVRVGLPTQGDEGPSSTI